MKKIFLYYLIVALFFIACAKVPITGRKQFNMLPESMLASESLTSYRQFLGSHKVVSATAEAQMVKNVGSRISRAVENYLLQKKQKDRVRDYKWEFNLVQDPTVNAWCMPGGKVVFYSGIMPVTQTEVGIAVVMGHEIAHAVARHGNERMSQMLAMQMGGIALAVALNDKPDQTRNMILAAYGIGTTVGVMLPFSRQHESEADKMGLVFMALAGYNPEEAISFWQRMAANSKGTKPPEFLSTHPADETRIKDLRAFLPQAKKYYKP